MTDVPPKPAAAPPLRQQSADAPLHPVGPSSRQSADASPNPPASTSQQPTDASPNPPKPPAPTSQQPIDASPNSDTPSPRRKGQPTTLPPVEVLASISKAPFVDTHTHLHYVLDRLPERFGVTSYNDLRHAHFPPNLEAVVNVLCEPASFQGDLFAGTFLDYREMAKVDYMYLAAGCHPHNAKEYNDYVERMMVDVLLHPKCIALGEIGLDYHYDNSPRDVQRRVFEQQIGRAIAFKLPLVIHTREAEDDTWEIMTRCIPSDWKIHVHCFTDSPSFAKRLLDHFPNLYIGITGVLTFGSAKNTQEIVRSVIPKNRFLLETDAPYMVPAKLNHRKKSHEKVTICHSGMIPLIAERIAQLKNVDVDVVMEAARRNTRDMYGI